MTPEERRYRETLIRVDEALEDHDVRHARRLIAVALEPPAQTRKLTCEECGLKVRFPGELVDHLAWIHGRRLAA